MNYARKKTEVIALWSSLIKHPVIFRSINSYTWYNKNLYSVDYGDNFYIKHIGNILYKKWEFLSLIIVRIEDLDVQEDLL